MRPQNRQAARSPHADEQVRWLDVRVRFQSRGDENRDARSCPREKHFPPIRRDIHEANQPVIRKRSHVNEGPAEDRVKVAAVVVIPARREQAVQRLII